MHPKDSSSLRPATAHDRTVVTRLFAAYQRTIAAFDSTIDPGLEFEEVWLEKPGELFPFLILEGGEPVGLLLVYGKRYAEAAGDPGDFSVYALYLEEQQRGNGLAEAAVRELLAAAPGEWCAQVLARNAPAMRFWERTLRGPTFGLTKGPCVDGLIPFCVRSGTV